MEPINCAETILNNLLEVGLLRSYVRHVLKASPLQALAGNLDNSGVLQVSKSLVTEVGAQDKLTKLFAFEEERPPLHQLYVLFKSEGVGIDAGPGVEHVLTHHVFN
jgi:hypothetical protein